MARRLTKIEQLPSVAMQAIGWAWDAIRDERLQLNSILVELNGRLASLGVAQVSASAFSRYSLAVRSGGIKRPVERLPSAIQDDARSRLALAIERLDEDVRDLRKLVNPAL